MSTRKHKTLKTLFRLSALAFTGMYFTNRFIQKHAEEKHILKKGMGHSYPWQFGDVFYQITGSGERKLLLIHDANAYASSYEWSAILDLLKDDFTVYTMDLPGCGRSDKPAITYTNYIYVQLIQHFIQDVIKEPVELAATGLSASFAMAAAHAYPDNISKVIMINPWSPKKLAKIPDNTSKSLGLIMSIPVLGTFVYNLINSRSNLEYILDEKCFYNPFKVREQLIDACYESAHLRPSGSGRYMQAHLDGRYLNWNMNRAVSNAKQPVTVVCGENLETSVKSAASYVKLNPAVKVVTVPHAKMFPQLEEPAVTVSIFIND